MIGAQVVHAFGCVIFGVGAKQMYPDKLNPAPITLKDLPLDDLIQAELRDHDDGMSEHREALRDWQHRLARSQMADRQRKIDDLSQSLAQLDQKNRQQGESLKHVKSQYAHTLMTRTDQVPEWGPGSKPRRDRVTSDD
jgi:hypothetical protein